MPLPEELTTLPQWCWSTLQPLSGGGVDKRPLMPNGQAAEVNNPYTWSTYEECATVVAQHGGAVGFILTPDDPYTLIDLDHVEDENIKEAQRLVWEEFSDSYCEYSQSGNGIHIIARGNIGGGIRRKGVEVYDRGRYAIFTGNQLNGETILDKSLSLIDLVQGFGGIDLSGHMPDSQPEIETDDAIWARMMASANGAKIHELFTAALAEDADGWSERDAAVAQVIAYYTRNHDQALRLFRRSTQYNPERKAAKSGYKTIENYEQGYLLRVTFKKQWQHLEVHYGQRDHGAQVAATLLGNHEDAQRLRLEEARQRVAALPPPPENMVPDNSIPCPPGLLGQIASYIYQTSPKPVWEIAISVAIPFCSAIFGNRWRSPTNAQLGHYVVLLSKSGTGKTSAINRLKLLAQEVTNQGNPLLDMLRGPTHFSSGQALTRQLGKSPVFYAMLGEIGSTFQKMQGSKTPDYMVEFERVLLELYDMTSFDGSAYAQNKDSIGAQVYPCFSFVGDTRAEKFFSLVDESFATEGMLPRLTLIEYDGPIVPDQLINPVIPQPLVDLVSSAVTNCSRDVHGVACVGIAAGAQAYLNQLSEEQRRTQNSTENEMIRASWGRFANRIGRLAAVVACGENYMEPVVTVAHLQWAEGIVRWGLTRVLGERIQAGRIGDGERRFLSDIRDFVTWYSNASSTQRINQKCPKALAHHAHIFPYAAFRHRVRSRARYYDHKLGLERAVEMALDTAVKVGYLDQLTQEQCFDLGYSGRTPVYTLGEEG